MSYLNSFRYMYIYFLSFATTKKCNILQYINTFNATNKDSRCITAHINNHEAAFAARCARAVYGLIESRCSRGVARVVNSKMCLALMPVRRVGLLNRLRLRLLGFRVWGVCAAPMV